MRYMLCCAHEQLQLQRRKFDSVSSTTSARSEARQKWDPPKQMFPRGHVFIPDFAPKRHLFGQSDRFFKTQEGCPDSQSQFSQRSTVNIRKQRKYIEHVRIGMYRSGMTNTREPRR